MTSYLYIPLLLLSLYGNTQTVAIPDENFEKALISLKIDDEFDGKIDLSRAKEVTELDIRGKEIKSLVGLEAFTNLKSIACSENKIEEANFDLNPQLEYIIILRNRLTKLEVSKNLNLVKLSCSYNRLTNLTLASPKLVTIFCDNNNLVSLNVGSCLGLRGLYANKNSLNTLDISNNVNLINLECPLNRLESIDLSQNGLLEKLNISNNSLNELNVETNERLLNLYCSSNNISTIDLRGRLEVLFCDNNRLTHINLNDVTSLTDINCENNQLKIVDLSNLFQIESGNFKNNSELQAIILSNGLVNNDFKLLKDSNAKFMKKNSGEVFLENSFEYKVEAPPKLEVTQNARVSESITVDHSELDLKYTNEPIIDNVDNKPEFLKGASKLSDYLKNNIVYPKIGYKPNGNVLASFIVEKSGEISNVQIKQGLGFGSHEAVSELLYNMPKWKPATKDGRPVRSMVSITIQY